MRLAKEIILLCISFFTFSLSVLSNRAQDVAKCKEIHASWLNEALELTRQTPGYSAPVAVRTFSYLSIARYEASLELFPELQSLSGQLSDWKRTTWMTPHESISYPWVANEVNFELIKYFYVNMPPRSAEKIKVLYDQLKSKLKKRSKKQIVVSQNYANKLAQEIIAWSKGDGADNCWNTNFPSDFKEKECHGCWTKTFPGFEKALQPYWGKNRPMLASNVFLCEDLIPLDYSTEPHSEFFQENQKMVDFYRGITQEQRDIAKFWDDSPGVSGTPVGHLYGIAFQFGVDNKLSLDKELQLYALLGITLNDAVIEAWRLKYKYNVIRPISYIQKHIEPTFNTAIPTPPFPEFPSGHSFQAGAGSVILKFFFSDSTSFTDQTNVFRTDINGTARRYVNVSAMAKEMSKSRFYGGIHFDHTLVKSLEFGQKIGENTLLQLKFVKP